MSGGGELVGIGNEQRELLRGLSSDLQTAESRLFTQVESTFKWLMATLWASNGGALLATIGAQEFAQKLGLLPFVCFAVGLVLSLIMGLINLLYCSRSMLPITELKNLFVIGSTVGDFDPDDVQPLVDRINRSTIFKWPLWASGIGSLVLLVIGAATAAVRIWA